MAVILVSPQIRGFPKLFLVWSVFFSMHVNTLSMFPLLRRTRSVAQYFRHYQEFRWVYTASQTDTVCVCNTHTHTRTHAVWEQCTQNNTETQGCTNFQKSRSYHKILGARAVGDMQQLPDWWPTNISHHSTEFSRQGDLAPGVRTPPFKPNQRSVNFIMRIFTCQSQWPSV
jgi:hypothetical protein